MMDVCKLCGQILSAATKKIYVPVIAKRTASRTTQGSVHCSKSGVVERRRRNSLLSHPRSFSSVSAEEMEKFSKLASSWWDGRGEMAPLHSMNSLRVPFIRDSLLYQGMGTPNCPTPLRDVDILDVGCGAGILSEPLARLGANVVGIDSSKEALDAGKLHRSNDPDLKTLQYLDSWLEDIVAVGTIKFDCVIASEVVEHVTNYDNFLQMCSAVLKPGGSIFVSTINRTNLSYFLGIVFAERIWGVVAPGTHTWEQLVRPDELEAAILKAGCSVRKLHGMLYDPFRNRWSWSGGTDLNYIVHAVKSDSEREAEECERSEPNEADSRNELRAMD